MTTDMATSLDNAPSDGAGPSDGEAAERVPCTQQVDDLLPCVGPVVDGLCAMHRAAGANVREMLAAGPLPWGDEPPTMRDVAWLDKLSRWYDATSRDATPDPDVTAWVHTQASLLRRGTLTSERFTLLDRTPGWEWISHSVPLGKQAAEARMASILAMFDADETLEAIGDEFGLSRERVRQLVKPFRPTRSEVPRQRPQPPPPTPAEMAEGIREALRGNPPPSGAPMRDLFNRFTPSPLLAPAAYLEKPVPMDEWEARWIERLQSAAAVKGEPLLRSRYDEWAVAHSEPKAQTAQLRGHQWAEICELAGVATKSSSPRGPRSDRVWDIDVCESIIDAFVEWALRHDRRPSKGAYDLWLDDHDGPSWELLRRRFASGLQSRVIPRSVELLTEHFAAALQQLDAGESVDPETYEGPLNTD